MASFNGWPPTKGLQIQWKTANNSITKVSDHNNTAKVLRYSSTSDSAVHFRISEGKLGILPQVCLHTDSNPRPPRGIRYRRSAANRTIHHRTQLRLNVWISKTSWPVFFSLFHHFSKILVCVPPASRCGDPEFENGCSAWPPLTGRAYFLE